MLVKLKSHLRTKLTGFSHGAMEPQILLIEGVALSSICAEGLVTKILMENLPIRSRKFPKY